MEKLNYKAFQLNALDKIYLQLGKDIIDKNYTILKKLKDSPRNFVAIINWKDKLYVLKEPRNEYRIPQRQFFSFFKEGESLSTLKNVHNLIHTHNFEELVPIYLSGTKRNFGFITDSFLVMEYVEGTIKNDSYHKNQAVEIMKKIHSKGFYHGDFNPSNFIFDQDDNIHILDTKGASYFFGNFRPHYDMITMWYDSYKEMTYPYPKNIWYHLAFSLKLFKRNKIIHRLKNFKKNLRNRGWKI